MEASRNLFSSPPTFSTRTQLKNSIVSSPSSSVSMLHEQIAPAAATSIPKTSATRHFPTSVLSQEQRDDCRSLPVLQLLKEDKSYPGATNEQQIDNETTLQWSDLRQLLSLLNMKSVVANTDETMNVESSNVVALAKKALSASKRAAALADDFKLDLDDSLSYSLGSADPSKLPVDEEEPFTIRSTKRLERQSKRTRRQSKFTISETYSTRKTNVRKKSRGSFDPNDAFQLFLRNPETTQLLTAKEEFELIVQVQDLMRLTNVKSKLQSQFGREPTVVEWAEATSLSCSALQAELHVGNKCREKLIYANFRMVVHVAKQYQGRGMNLQDLLQEGSLGLIKSVEKFKPQVGCRFATYAYWWIRQTISKSIVQHSRTIRLPENVYGLLGKVVDARRSYIREGNYQPSKEEVARRVGLTVERLDRLLVTTRTPISIQQTIWSDQDTTFQEVTPDTGIEIPNVSVAKQLMRQHVRNLLHVLSPRERKIIRLRFGIEEKRENSLSEIGNMFGLSKERVRQLESKALYKLKQCMVKQGLGVYEELII